MKVDDEALAVFEAEGVRHEVLVKINQLAMYVCNRVVILSSSITHSPHLSY